MQQAILVFIAVLAGMVLPLQASLNAKMGAVVQNPLLGSLLSFLVGTVGLLVYIVVSRVPISNLLMAKTAPAILWLAGILGAFYVTAIILLVPRLGVALTFGLVIAGQMVVSILFDHFGVLGTPVQPFNWMRLLGVMMLIGGVLILRKY
ncbi:MAG TPA: DMT family transporter [Flavihumibacter sp.]|jgi:transporter family-2 protein